jgi:hypothetical protein
MPYSVNEENLSIHPTDSDLYRNFAARKAGLDDYVAAKQDAPQVEVITQ